jgi:hypothetical protein
MLATNFEFLSFKCDWHFNLKIRKPIVVTLEISVLGSVFQIANGRRGRVKLAQR